MGGDKQREGLRKAAIPRQRGPACGKSSGRVGVGCRGEGTDTSEVLGELFTLSELCCGMLLPLKK